MTKAVLSFSTIDMARTGDHSKLLSLRKKPTWRCSLRGKWNSFVLWNSFVSLREDHYTAVNILAKSGVRGINQKKGRNSVRENQ